MLTVLPQKALCWLSREGVKNVFAESKSKSAQKIRQTIDTPEVTVLPQILDTLVLAK